MNKSATVRQFPPTPAPARSASRRRVDLPKAPRALTVEARRRWRDLVEQYEITDAAGLQVLMTYCEAFERMRHAQTAITRDGATLKDRFGQMKAHPLLSVERDARAAMLHALKALNLDLEPVRDRPGRPGGGS